MKLMEPQRIVRPVAAPLDFYVTEADFPEESVAPETPNAMASPPENSSPAPPVAIDEPPPLAPLPDPNPDADI